MDCEGRQDSEPDVCSGREVGDMLVTVLFYSSTTGLVSDHYLFCFTVRSFTILAVITMLNTPHSISRVGARQKTD
jgi:hypothetical protein